MIESGDVKARKIGEIGLGVLEYARNPHFPAETEQGNYQYETSNGKSRKYISQHADKKDAAHHIFFYISLHYFVRHRFV